MDKDKQKILGEVKELYHALAHTDLFEDIEQVKEKLIAIDGYVEVLFTALQCLREIDAKIDLAKFDFEQVAMWHALYVELRKENTLDYSEVNEARIFEFYEDTMQDPINKE